MEENMSTTGNVMTRPRRTWPVIVGAMVGLALTAASEPAAAAPNAAAGRGGAALASTVRAVIQTVTDFNGDGLADLVVGLPFDDVAGVQDAGGVNVIYGSSGGLDSSISHYYSENSPGFLAQAAADDEFGTAVAAGDFDGDGFSDLAIGVPGKNYQGSDDGLVRVLYGGPGGLIEGTETWSQGTFNIAGYPDNNDRFGTVLVAADFGNGPQDDLAVGVPLEDINGNRDAGGVNIIYGTASGLEWGNNFLLSQDHPDIYGDSELEDHFGFALAAADFGDSAHADLAVSVPDEDFQGTDDGGVHVIAGGTSGLNTADSYFWSQGTSRPEGNVDGTVQDYDKFGWSLAAGDFGNGAHADLAVGVPYEDEIIGLEDAGAVNVLYGSASGLTAAGDQLWSEQTLGISGDPVIGDHFGYSLAAANFGNGPNDDLAVGVPSKDVNGAGAAGGVNVIYGSLTGLNSTNEFLFFQDTVVNGLPEGGDNFGWSLAAADFGNGSYADLAIGVPFERTVVDTDGAVGVLYGSTTGLGPAHAQLWHQNSVGIYGDPLLGDNFGYTLTTSG
jgi:hypothetical protein